MCWYVNIVDVSLAQGTEIFKMISCDDRMWFSLTLQENIFNFIKHDFTIHYFILLNTSFGYMKLKQFSFSAHSESVLQKFRKTFSLRFQKRSSKESGSSDLGETLSEILGEPSEEESPQHVPSVSTSNTQLDAKEEPTEQKYSRWVSSIIFFSWMNYFRKAISMQEKY